METTYPIEKTTLVNPNSLIGKQLSNFSKLRTFFSINVEDKELYIIPLLTEKLTKIRHKISYNRSIQDICGGIIESIDFNTELRSIILIRINTNKGFIQVMYETKNPKGFELRNY